MILSTSRLSLEPLESTHADHLFAGLREPQVYEFIDDEPPQNVEALRARFEKLASRKSLDGRETWLNWAIWLRDESRFIGHVQATLLVENGSAEIAYLLFRDCWGRGFAREAVAAMTAFLQREFDVRYFRARVDPRNDRSIRLLSALGFERVSFQSAVKCVRDAFVDEAGYLRIVP